MLTILSPAKTISAFSLEGSPLQGLPITRPQFLNCAMALAGELKTLSPWQLEKPLQVSPALALRAFAYFQSWNERDQGTAALLAFRGLQYTHLEAHTLDLEDFAFAQEHLRILSAFYGLLRPCDGICPYRLEFQSKRRFQGKGLYNFWGETLYEELYRRREPVLNLASGEYAKAILPHLRQDDQFITCDFVTTKLGKRRILPTEAKMARGHMARYVLKNRIDRPEDVKTFSWDDYVFVPRLSTGENYVFMRTGETAEED